MNWLAYFLKLVLLNSHLIDFIIYWGYSFQPHYLFILLNQPLPLFLFPTPLVFLQLSLFLFINLFLLIFILLSLFCSQFDHLNSLIILILFNPHQKLNHQDFNYFLFYLHLVFQLVLMNHRLQLAHYFLAKVIRCLCNDLLFTFFKTFQILMVD